MKSEASNPSSSGFLQQIISGLTHRWRLSLAIKGLGWGIVTGLFVLLSVALTSRFITIWSAVEVRRTTLWFLTGGAVSGTLAGALYRMPITKRLRLFDSQLDMADRLTTAWELEHGRITAPPHLVQLQLEETRLWVSKADIKTAFPAQPTRYSIVATGLLMLLLLPALFLPNPRDTILTRRKAEEQFVAQAVEKITQSHDALIQQSTLTSEEQTAALTALEQALDALNDRQSTLDDKQTALTLAEYQLAKLRTPESQITAEQISSVPALSDDSNLPDSSVIKDLNEALSNGNVKEVSAMLENLAQSETGQQLTPEEIQALSSILAQLASAIEEQQPESASALDTAARALTEGNTAAAREGLQGAAQSLSELAEAQAKDATLQQVQAGVQQAQQSLRQAADSGAGQPGTASGSPAIGQSGSSNGTDEGSGSGEDSEGENNGNSSTPSDAERERLEAVGGEITIPRSPEAGNPQPASGIQNEARMPYQEIYAEYADAAEAGLSRRDYPPLLRDYIRDYFSSLEE